MLFINSYRVSARSYDVIKSNKLKTPIFTAFMAIKSHKLGAKMIVCVLDTLIPPNYSRPSRSLHSFLSVVL